MSRPTPTRPPGTSSTGTAATASSDSQPAGRRSAARARRRRCGRALITLADASSACGGSPLGFAGPALYHAAGQAYATDFNDVLTGNNDFTHTNNGQFAAGTGYDEATGLGTPNAAALATALCAGTLKLGSPGARRSTARASVSLRLRFSDGPGAAVRLEATGLPPGLSLNPVTGRITGRPRRTGRFEVSVIAQDAFGASASIAFGWTIGAAPHVSRLSVSGLQQDRPQLGFTLSAGRRAPAFAQLRLALPGGLRLASAQAVRLHGRTAPASQFTAHLVHGALEIKLRHPLGELHLALSYPDLRVDHRPQPQTRRRSGDTHQLSLRIIDADAGATIVHARLMLGP